MKYFRKRRKLAKPKNLRGFIRNEAGIYIDGIRRVVDYPMFKGFGGLIKRVFPNAMSMDDFLDWAEENYKS